MNMTTCSKTCIDISLLHKNFIPPNSSQKGSIFPKSTLKNQMIKSSDQPHHQSFFETLQLYWFYFRPWVFKRFDLFMISALWQVHSMPDLKCTKVPFQLCAKIHCMCVGRSHKNSRKIEKLYKNMRVVYLIYLSILLSRYRSCDDT